MSECMTQEDAERMGASQAVQILKPLRTMMLDRYGCPISEVYFALGKAIEALEQPTVDAVPVVRCKDYLWRHDDSSPMWLPCMEHETPNDWFCADRERNNSEIPNS